METYVETYVETVFEEECFGPVIPIIEAASDEHAVELATQSVFGLGAAVFTRDLEKQIVT